MKVQLWTLCRKMEVLLFVFVTLIHVSQRALAVVVQAYEGMESVLLPCQYSGKLPVVPSVVWRRSDLNQTLIYLLKDKSDDVKEEYSDRMSMKTDVLKSGDFSLTVKKPQLSDSSNYTCNLRWETEWKETKEWRLTQVQLQVKDDEEEVKVQQGVESIQLPCNASLDLPEDTTVDWTHFDPKLVVVHVYRNKADDFKTQDKFYRDRTEMNKDMSLTLKKPIYRDRGMYICTVYREGDVLRSKVLLQVVQGGFPTWATALLVVFAVLLIILLGLVFIFRGYFLSVPQVEVDSGEESVLLPCKTIAHLTKNFRHISVMWRNFNNDKLVVHKYGSGEPDEQDQIYRNRTEMKTHWLRTGDFSLTLKHPRALDATDYLCIVYNENKVLKKKLVTLKVKVKQVEVDSGEESVLLPWETTFQLTEDVTGQVTVEWADEADRKVHVYEDGSDRANEQDDQYKNRTEMKADPLGTGDLSLTLKDPTDHDTDTYTCTVYNGDKQILRRKQVHLKVKAQQVEVDSGEESVLLPWKASFYIQDASQVTVEWMDDRNRKVHVYEDGSDRTNEQDDIYRNRTEMKADPLGTGDLSLTLKDPTDLDTDIYTCTVYIRDRQILRVLRRKQVRLWVKAQQVEVVPGEESVLLPWNTSFHTQDISQATVEWTDDKNRKVHVYEFGSDRTNEQDDECRNRTEMNEDPLGTGDLGLTLKHLTDLDTDIYTCTVFNRDKQILRRKQVYLKVKDQEVEVKEGARSAQLPFSTTPDLPRDATVEWRCYVNDHKYMYVHGYEKGLARLGQQSYIYENRTKMNEDPWTTGDFSLTLYDLQQYDSGRYECKVIKDRVTLRCKTVMLKVKGQRSDAGQRSSVSPSSVSSADRSQITYQSCPIREDEEAV